MDLLYFSLGIAFIVLSLWMLIRNNQSSRAFKLGMLVLIGISGLAIEVFVIEKYTDLNLMNIQVQFVGTEIIKSFVLLAFGKQIKNLT